MSLADIANVGSGHLLVVEEDTLVAWALQRAAASANLDVRWAETAAAALASLRAQPCDLAFVDIRLPDGDGIELLPELTSLAPNMRVVVITADPTPSNRERAFRRGAWDFMEKPFNLVDVTRVIDDCFAPQQNRRSHERQPCSFALRLDVLSDADVVTPSVQGRALDVSRTGLRLETEYQLEAGQGIRVRPAHSATEVDPAMRAEAVARVVWTKRGGRGVTAGLTYL